MQISEVQRFRLFGVPIAAADMSSAIQEVSSWIERGDRGRMVTFTNVHMLVESIRHPEFVRLMQRSDLNCPDGVPLVWCGRGLARKSLSRVCGPDFLPRFCEVTADKKLRHFFFGCGEGVAAKAAANLQKKFPGMQIAGVYSPPFRKLSAEEEEEVVQMINAARPHVLWVSLGCPKQELWVDRFRYRVDVPVLLAVGLAVDIAAGAKKRAPYFMRISGLEWLYRLCQEPRRLWRRYVIYNSIFVYHVLREGRRALR
ncbi:MAG: WecB/TagA/CpsF family glycosyltransferase [Terracidiphilus sp.]